MQPSAGMFGMHSTRSPLRYQPPQSVFGGEVAGAHDVIFARLFAGFVSLPQPSSIVSSCEAKLFGHVHGVLTNGLSCSHAGVFAHVVVVGCSNVPASSA